MAHAALAFASMGIGFGIFGVPLAEDSALIEAGLDLALSPNATLGASYAGQLADDIRDHAVKGRLNWPSEPRATFILLTCTSAMLEP